jgi:hypothetical protein
MLKIFWHLQVRCACRILGHYGRALLGHHTGEWLLLFSAILVGAILYKAFCGDGSVALLDTCMVAFGISSIVLPCCGQTHRIKMLKNPSQPSDVRLGSPACDVEPW